MKRLMGRLTSLPFDFQGTFLHMYSRKGLLGLENEKCVVSYLGRAQLLLLFILELSVHRGQTLAAQPGTHLSPASEWNEREGPRNGKI